MFLLSGKFLRFKIDVSSRYKFHIKYKKSYANFCIA